MSQPSTILYKRATFVTQLPVEHLYAPSHAWLSRATETRWRVGFTKFALRMLGELVDVQFDQAPGATLAPGDVVGSIEGFKAVSDLFCPGRGTFVRGNPALATDLEPILKSPYADGWIYEFDGIPDDRCLEVGRYQELLDATIDRILAKQKADEPAP